MKMLYVTTKATIKKVKKALFFLAIVYTEKKIASSATPYNTLPKKSTIGVMKLEFRLVNMIRAIAANMVSSEAKK